MRAEGQPAPGSRLGYRRAVPGAAGACERVHRPRRRAGAAPYRDERPVSTEAPEEHTALTLHHQDLGRGPPVVFLHGWGMSLEVWERQVHAQADRHRTVCADLRGHGASPKTLHGYRYGDQCAGVVDLLTRLDLDDATLVGWSMAGSMGALIARASPRVSRLVLVGTPSRLTPDDDYPAGADLEGGLGFR